MMDPFQVKKHTKPVFHRNPDPTDNLRVPVELDWVSRYE